MFLRYSSLWRIPLNCWINVIDFYALIKENIIFTLFRNISYTILFFFFFGKHKCAILEHIFTINYLYNVTHNKEPCYLNTVYCSAGKSGSLSLLSHPNFDSNLFSLNTFAFPFYCAIWRFAWSFLIMCTCRDTPYYYGGNNDNNQWW